jgi:nucleoside-diphosphate-sugar epimerase
MKENRRKIRIPRRFQQVISLISISIIFTICGVIFYGGNSSILVPNVSYINPTRKRALIVGAGGYIGSRLYDHLNNLRWDVLAIDRMKPSLVNFSHIIEMSASDLTEDMINSVDVVFYFGGCSGRHVCPQEKNVYFRENVKDIERLARRMQSRQLLVFASTGALAEGSGDKPFSEDESLSTHLFDLYTESMMLREKALRELSTSSASSPVMVGFRFGTVIGLSPSQRLDLVHIALVCSAFTTGVLSLQHSESHRAVLYLDDLVRALHTVASLPSRSQRFDVFNLQSFSGSIAFFANEVASQTGALIHAQDLSPSLDIIGFSLDTRKFSAAFGFTFLGTNNGLVAELIQHATNVCVGRDLLYPPKPQSEPCVVCGNTHMVQVLDLGAQPLANDFRKTLVDFPRYPLSLVRCPVCMHTQLSYFVDRGTLFRHYLYVSGTSRTLLEYFEWLANKVMLDSDSEKRRSGSVLELACNDGSQLDKFKALGWRTFGVDPAANLAESAILKGHAVHVGFWGVDHFPKNGIPYPLPSELTAIVAQNVFAHVLNPVDFLRACVTAMGVQTRLYIQTSQCRMLETGEFDTIYHEHVSFFTAHSFDYIARTVGLRIINFEHTPIHGVSCLLTLVREDSKIPSTTALSTALNKEVSLGLSSDFNFVLYRSKAYNMRKWLNMELERLSNRGYAIVGFGAAAKGVVLLHFLRVTNPKYNFLFVIDESPLKQGTYIPGTDVQIKSTVSLLDISQEQPVAIVIFAWNFLDEIVSKIRSAFNGKGPRRIIGLVPFPTARIVDLSLNSHEVLLRNPFRALAVLPVMNINRKRVVLITHFFNDEFMLPYFIQHHSSLFDEAVLIDCHSTDGSVDIIRRSAPASWRIVRSRNKKFDPVLLNDEVRDHERTVYGSWKIALTTREFLVHPDLRGYLESVNDETLVLRFRSFLMAGNDAVPLKRFSSLVKQRSAYIVPSHNEQSGDRLMHRFETSLEYTQRDSAFLNTAPLSWTESGYVSNFQFTPLLTHQHNSVLSDSVLSDFSSPDRNFLKLSLGLALFGIIHVMVV